ncbi:MAG: exosortase/archaeosortase family protein [archaeon]|nr:MAG: exosortase/archaeosortase family protein [archaeon]
MRRPDRGVIRFFLWLALAISISSTLYLGQLVSFFGLLDGKLDETFGSSFPAIPFVALLAVLFIVRWYEFHGILQREEGLSGSRGTRLVGLALILLPLPFSPFTARYLELSAATLIMSFYGASLVINPRTRKFLLPYAALYLVGVTAPSGIQYAFGEPLAGLSTSLTALLVNLSGIPVAWQGTQFELISRSGEVVSGTITAGCSSILSVTTFLGLLGLMHFDLRKDKASTLKTGVVGVLVLVFLNSVRIGILLWAGYDGGSEALWGLHNWIGYAIFLGFYVAVLVVYSRMGSPTLYRHEAKAGRLNPGRPS